MKRFLLALSLTVVCTTWCNAKDDNPAYTDAKSGGIDFEIQGEYSGDLGDGNKWGAQVIALGDGKFESVGYKGGLPGDGWDKNEGVNRVDGKLDGESAVFEGDGFVLKISDGSLNVQSLSGDNYGTLKKVERKSSTLGAKPPKGAKVLFDGTSVDQWDNGEIVEEKLLGATGVQTKAEFGDHSLHLEFRTPFMPKSKGQARGNSGMYVHCRYEVQVLDSFGLDGKDNECGGIYSISKPNLNMCYPPLSWQTYDYDFKAARYDDDGKKTANARITLKHNGVVIHDNLEIKHGTPGKDPEGPGKKGLFLQDHGNPVAFRNIWVVESKSN